VWSVPGSRGPGNDFLPTLFRSSCQALPTAFVSAKDIEATPLYLAAAKGFVKVVKVLCRSRADVNKTPTCTSATPLYMACLNGHLEVVQSLCLARADLNKEVLRNRQTPLFVAAKNGHLDIAKTLSVAGADLHKASSSEVTPLHMAAMNGHYDLVEGLVSRSLCFRAYFFPSSDLVSLCFTPPRQ